MEHEKEELQEILETFLREIGELTGVLQDYDFSSVYTIHEEYRGDGWGKATPECVQQIYELAQTEGIYVEQVYTSKTLYGMLDMVRKGLVDGSACYLHTADSAHCSANSKKVGGDGDGCGSQNIPRSAPGSGAPWTDRRSRGCRKCAVPNGDP